MKTIKSIKMNNATNAFFSKRILSLVLVSFVLFSCNDEENVNATISEEEAAEVIVQAISGTSGGEAGQIESAARIAEDIESCGVQKDSVISKSSLPGAVVTYLFNLEWDYSRTCEPGAIFQASFSGNTVYDAPRMSSDDKSTGTFTISDFGSASTSYTYNSSYTREGSQVSKVRYKRHFTSKTIITSTNIKVDKATKKILSGEATATISGGASTGESFSYSGTITFNGDQKATLKFQNGSSYSINW